jgi:hypothetical protein
MTTGIRALSWARKWKIFYFLFLFFASFSREKEGHNT